MSTAKEAVEYLVSSLGPQASTRAMMGEYVLYWRGRVVGGMYDDRLLVKNLPPLREALEGPLVSPYPGAKDMIHVPIPDDEAAAQHLRVAFEAVWLTLPTPKSTGIPKRERSSDPRGCGGYR